MLFPDKKKGNTILQNIDLSNFDLFFESRQKYRRQQCLSFEYMFLPFKLYYQLFLNFEL